MLSKHDEISLLSASNDENSKINLKQNQNVEIGTNEFINMNIRTFVGPAVWFRMKQVSPQMKIIISEKEIKSICIENGYLQRCIAFGSQWHARHWMHNG